MEGSIKALRKAITAERSGVEQGPVVRFVWDVGTGGTYTYTALYVNKHWYVTGAGTLIGQTYTNEKFVREVLSEKACVDAVVATSWEAL